MTYIQLLLGGPAFAALALALFAIPGVRPIVFTRSTGWLAVCMCVPMVAGFVFHSYNLITLAFFIKPIAALLGMTLFLAYGVIWRSQRFSLITTLPSLMILSGSIADIYAVLHLKDGWGGAAC